MWPVTWLWHKLRRWSRKMMIAVRSLISRNGLNEIALPWRNIFGGNGTTCILKCRLFRYYYFFNQRVKIDKRFLNFGYLLSFEFRFFMGIKFGNTWRFFGFTFFLVSGSKYFCLFFLWGGGFEYVFFFYRNWRLKLN